MPVAYRQGQKAQYVDITLRLGLGGGCHLRHSPMSKVSALIFSQVEVEAQDLHPLLHIKGLICTSYSSSYSTSVRKTVVYCSSSWWLSVLKVGNMIKSYPSISGSMPLPHALWIKKHIMDTSRIKYQLSIYRWYIQAKWDTQCIYLRKHWRRIRKRRNFWFW